jgi:hypothetical protein
VFVPGAGAVWGAARSALFGGYTHATYATLRRRRGAVKLSHL